MKTLSNELNVIERSKLRIIFEHTTMDREKLFDYIMQDPYAGNRLLYLTNNLPALDIDTSTFDSVKYSKLCTVSVRDVNIVEESVTTVCDFRDGTTSVEYISLKEYKDLREYSPDRIIRHNMSLEKNNK